MHNPLVRALVMALSFLLTFVLFLHPINSGDFFHHLTAGRYIVLHQTLPYTDTATFTAYGRPWVANAWGADILFYLIYQATGPSGISIFFALLGVTTAGLLYKTLRLQGQSTISSIILTSLGATLMSLRWPTRTEVFGALFVMVLIWMLIQYMGESRGKFWGIQKTNFVPAVRFLLFFWLWGVIYGASSLLGIMVLAWFILSNKLFTWQSLALFLGCIGMSLLNGYGLQTLLYLIRIPPMAHHLGEWLPIWRTMDPNIPELVLFYQYQVLLWGIFALTVLTSFVVAWLAFRQAFINTLFFVGLAASVLTPFISTRFIGLAMLPAVIGLGVILYHAKPKIRKVFLAVVVLITIGATLIRFHLFSFGLGLEPDPFQTRAVQFLKQHAVNGTIYALQELGGFISWELPKSKIFVDTRDDLYQPTGLFEELLAVSNGNASMMALLDRYGADIVIADLAGGAIYKPLLYSNQWRLVYLTDGFFVSVRTKVAETYHLQSFDALDPFRVPPAKPGQLDMAKKELEMLLSENPHSPENRIRRSQILFSQGQATEAKTTVDRIDFTGFVGARAPVVAMETAILKGRLALGAGLCNQAYEELSRANRLRSHQLIFFPRVQLPSDVDRHLGDYYRICAHDAAAARTFYEAFLKQTNNPLEHHEIEQIIEKL